MCNFCLLQGIAMCVQYPSLRGDGMFLSVTPEFVLQYGYIGSIIYQEFYHSIHYIANNGNYIRLYYYRQMLAYSVLIVVNI